MNNSEKQKKVLRNTVQSKTELLISNDVIRELFDYTFTTVIVA